MDSEHAVVAAVEELLWQAEVETHLEAVDELAGVAGRLIAAVDRVKAVRAEKGKKLSHAVQRDLAALAHEIDCLQRALAKLAEG